MAAFVERISVSKLDAAKRQLHTAVRLWFDDGDPVAIHSLVSAAHEIIHTLFRRKGLKGLLFDSPGIPDELRTVFAQAVVSAANAFKHARHDPDGVTEFAPGFNDYLLWICVAGLWRMGEPFAIEEAAIIVWLAIQRAPWVVQMAGDRLPAVDSQEARHFENMSKKDFLRTLEVLWGDSQVQELIRNTRATILAGEGK
jgi:hypothetical protein